MVSKYLNNLNIRVKKHFNPNTYPDNSWYRCNLERNFDFVVLGDGRLCFQDYDVRNKKYFDWQLKGQTLLWDFMVLKQYFSILKPNGIVFFCVDDGYLHYGNMDVKDKRPYYYVINPYVLSSNKYKVILIKIQKKIPLLLFRIRDIFCLGDLGGKRKTNKDIVPLLEEIQTFCKERSIIVRFVSIKNLPIQILEELGIEAINKNELVNYIKRE